MPGDLSYSDTGQLTARSERGAESVRLATVAGLEDAVANLRIGIEQAERRLAEASRAHREALDAWTSLTASLGLSITPELADLLGFLACAMWSSIGTRRVTRHRRPWRRKWRSGRRSGCGSGC
jgi:hypothetical protein